MQDRIFAFVECTISNNIQSNSAYNMRRCLPLTPIVMRSSHLHTTEILESEHALNGNSPATDRTNGWNDFLWFVHRPHCWTLHGSANQSAKCGLNETSETTVANEFHLASWLQMDLLAKISLSCYIYYGCESGVSKGFNRGGKMADW